MDLPIELKNAVEKMACGYKQAELKKIAKALSDRYRNESGEGKVLLSEDIEAVVYALVRMPATYGAVYDALKYTLEFFDGDLKSLLDVGAGSGAATWAASSLLSFDSVVCIEREGAMRRTSEKLMREGSRALSSARWISADLTSSNIAASADLVISSYVLNEIAPRDRRFALDKLWNCSKKLLLLVEPGTPSGFAVLKDARTYLLEKGAHIVAPCPHERECRLAADDWCHFSCRIQRSKTHKTLKDADVPYEDEKYAYMAFVKEACARAKARILRHPYVEKGRISLELCGVSENKSVTVKKTDKELFKRARKAKHGDSIEIS